MVTDDQQHQHIEPIEEQHEQEQHEQEQYEQELHEQEQHKQEQYEQEQHEQEHEQEQHEQVTREKDLSALGHDNFIVDSGLSSKQANLVRNQNVDDVILEPDASNSQTVSDPTLPTDFQSQPKSTKRDHPDYSDRSQRSTRSKTGTSKNWKRSLDSKQPLD